MEEKNGRGIFLGVVGVATLVVAIIGATFAYFSASATVNDDALTGKTAKPSSAKLEVTKVLPASGDLIPLLDGSVAGQDNRFAAALTNNCAAQGGYAGCHIYQVKITNEGTEDVYVTAILTLTADGAPDMKWAKLDQTTLTASNFTLTSYNPTTSAIAVGTDTQIFGVSSTQGTVVESDTPKYVYIVVWLRDDNTEQNGETNKTYNGEVTAGLTTSDGQDAGTITATFTSVSP